MLISSFHILHCFVMIFRICSRGPSPGKRSARSVAGLDETATKARKPPCVTVDELRDRLADAADTLRRLPKPQGLERSLQSPWPDMLRDWLAYGDVRTQVKRAAPTPQAITRLDECLAWLHILNPTQRMVLWAREAERHAVAPDRTTSTTQTNHGKGRGATPAPETSRKMAKRGSCQSSMARHRGRGGLAP